MKLKIKNFVIDKNRLPGSLILHGILYIIFIFALAWSILFIIPIQEKIGGTVIIHTYGVPVEIRTKQEGPVFLKKMDGDIVQSGDLLATQVWNIDTTTFKALHRLVNSQFDIQTNSGLQALDQAATALRNARLPEIQGSINKIISAVSQYKIQLAAIDPRKVIDQLNIEIGSQQAALPLIDSLSRKKNEKLLLIKDQLARDKSLVQVGALSEEEYSATEAEFLDAESEQFSTGIERKATEQNISELESAIADRESSYRSQKARLLIAVEDARNQFLEMYYKTAPDKFIHSTVSGQISKPPQIVNGVEMASEQPIMIIVPDLETSGSEAYMYVGLKRAGEIRKGQNVFIELSEYNARDYGMVEGHVLSISPIPDSEQYRLDIETPVPLTTNFGFVIDAKPTYNGVGEILTNRMSIFRKILRELKWNQAKYERSPSSDMGIKEPQMRSK